MPGKLDSYTQKNQSRTFSNIIHKNKLKIDERSKCKTRHSETLRGKHRQNTVWHKSQQDLFWPTPRVLKITKINRWELIKLKRFCTAKETVNKMKRQHIEWEKIFANEVTNLGLTFKTYNSLCSSISKTQPKQYQTTQSKNCISKETFLQRRHTDGQRALEETPSSTNH